MKFKEINAPSLNDLFVTQIEEMILSGHLKTGEKLPPERELAETMKVNRSIVSSGIRQLVDSGFLVVKPRKGTFVSDFKRNGNIKTLIAIIDYSKGKFNPNLMQSIYDIRAIHDCKSAELAAIHRSDDDVIRLQEHLKAMDNSNIAEEKAEHHFEFFHSLSFASSNLVLPLIMQEFRDLYIKLYIILYNGGFLHERTMQLKELLDCVIDKDSQGAKTCAQNIIDSSTRSLETYFNS